MYHASTRLQHLLSPDAYWSSLQYSCEIESIFRSSWHFVGLRQQLASPGDFLTVDVCGRPVQIRNFDGQIHAVSNVCAHRHCLMTSEKCGRSEKLRCQYHGWEYDQHGSTQRIPQAQHFAPLDRTATKIPTYRVETCGPLVFVNFDDSAPGLHASLGNRSQMIEDRFGDHWQSFLSQEFVHSVNWKIPIENSLEAYHVPSIHADTFRDDPGEDRSEHQFDDVGSWFKTTLPFAPHSRIDSWFQKCEGKILKWFLRQTPTASYEQHLIFPNCLFSFTDMISLIHVVRPTGPKSCLSQVCQFGRVADSGISRRLSRVWGTQAAGLTLAIMKEDFQLYPDIQRGLDASQNEGMLGRCEERIYQFQSLIQKQLTEDQAPVKPPANAVARQKIEI